MRQPRLITFCLSFMLTRIGGFSVSRRQALVGGAAAVAAIGISSKAQASTLYQPSNVQNKLIVITGGNTGLGLESAKRLAAAGARVVITVRSSTKGEQALANIQSYLQERGVASTKISYVLMDLTDFDSVQQAAKTLSTGSQKIDVLLNNAGVMAIPEREITKDGYERTFQTNHLGHFVFTAKLMSQLAPDARIVNVSSEAHKIAQAFQPYNLNGEEEYGPWSSYSLSKLSNILFTKELQRRVDEAGKDYTVVSLHPGVVATDLGRYLVGEKKFNRMKTEGMTLKESILFGLLNKFTKTVEDGASTQIFAAADPSMPQNKGAYLKDCTVVSRLQASAEDPANAAQLWKASEEMTHVKFEL